VRLTLYVARDCHLCEIARDDLAGLGLELDLDVEEVDITGDPELERRYRPYVPVIEHDGERVSIYRVEPDALRMRSRPEHG
jgi:glutaredoxin